MSLGNYLNDMSYADYRKLPEGTTMQIIDGTPYNMSPALSTNHQRVSRNLLHLFMTYFKEKECDVFAAPFDVRLFAENKHDDEITNVVQPDISVICDKTKLDDKGCMGPPDLVIEILSLSTAALDKIMKRNLYESAGLKEYWIADPHHELVEVYHFTEKSNYGKSTVFSTADMINSCFFKELQVKVSEIFPSASSGNCVRKEDERKNSLRCTAMNAEEIWSTVLKKVEQTITTPSFDTWFRGTKGISLNDNLLTIKVNNEFQRDWLLQRYHDLISKSVNEVAAGDEPVEIDIVSEVGNRTDGIEMDKSHLVGNQELLRKINELTERVERLEEKL